MKIIFKSMIITLILPFTCLIDNSFSFTGIGLERVKRGEDCQRCDLSGEDLTGVDLSWVDLTGADLNEVNLILAKLKGVAPGRMATTNHLMGNSEMSY